jgi:lipid II isoglutaminyl synthase (glutamine-hydrolysing)
MDASGGVVTNAGDPHLLAISQGLKGKEISYFGFSDNLKEYFPSDYELAAVDTQRSNDKKSVNPDVQLTGFKDPAVTYRISDKNYSARLKLTGQHNFLNAAAALALAKKLLPQTADADLVRQLADVSLAFGRGEKYRLKNGVVVELVLVKNPASFTQALASYGSSKANLMIAINDNIADGRDVSWLWDVNFGPLASSKVAVTSGSRAADMALRLKYDNIAVGQIEPNLAKALNQLSTKKGEKVILATYTAMLSLYSYLTKNAEKIE